MKNAKRILREILIGLAVWELLVLAVLSIFTRQKLACAGGVLVGGVAAAILILHMYRHLDIALDMDAKHAQSHIQFAAMQRLLIMGAVLAVSMIEYKYIHPVGTVLGIFGMKIAAYLQPTVHKTLIGFKRKKSDAKL